MPATNSRKVYFENGIYHIYNRGVDKRIIFENSQHYSFFLYLLKRYLTPPDKQARSLQRPGLSENRYSKFGLWKQIDLLAYCLMPNHFHLLIQQKEKESMPSLMQKVANSYSRYFNQQTKRRGSLFEGRYKAVMITNDEQLLQVTRYIHRNPEKITGKEDIASYPYSSFSSYLNEAPAWLHTQTILAYYNQGSPQSDLLAFTQELEIGDIIEQVQKLSEVKKIS